MQKIALIHDWLVGIGGGEKVLESLLKIYKAPIYTLVKDEKKLKNSLLENQIITPSFLQKIPFSTKFYRYFLPLFPKAIESFNLHEYQIILSLSHAVAKGVKVHPNQIHVCYCFTPMRYIWDFYHLYFNDLKGMKKVLVEKTCQYLRKWDLDAAKSVTHFATLSHYVAQRIRRIYKREAKVIYPPVNTHLFQISTKKKEYYVTCSRFVPYKKIDLIAKTFSKMPEKKLLIIGDGPEMGKIKEISCRAKNIEILGSQSDSVIQDLLPQAKAFIFAAEEEFGIICVEAQAAGVPAIAYGKGACLETIIPEKTGLFFQEQTEESLLKAIQTFERKQDQFIPEQIKAHAETFSEEKFLNEFQTFFSQVIENK
ncbi:MAG: glycosyltransferase [Chlamydiae bacterium]|nr:glycosyltransferase [Chlamydiota bacterium]